ADETSFDEQLDARQKDFLETALAHYENFTSRASHDPAVRLEHGRDYQRMGNIQRKLGKLDLAERAYRRSAELLEPLTAAPGAGTGRAAKQALARTRTLLADLLVRRGADKGQAEALYRQALEAQQVLADPQQDPAATIEDHLRLAQTFRSR